MKYKIRLRVDMLDTSPIVYHSDIVPQVGDSFSGNSFPDNKMREVSHRQLFLDNEKKEVTNVVSIILKVIE